MNGDLAIYTLAASIAGLAVVWFFKSPKELIADLTKRVEAVEREHDTVSDTVTAHTVELRHAAKAIEALTAEVVRLRDAIIGKFGNAPRRR